MRAAAAALALAGVGAAGSARAGQEWLTVPVILADFYGFAYYQAFEDGADAYGWTVAGVDALGWGIVAGTRKYEGLFLVNLANTAKLAYPAVRLAGSPERQVKRRAWLSLGTHTGTLLLTKYLGKPAIRVESRAPAGVLLAYEF